MGKSSISFGGNPTPKPITGQGDVTTNKLVNVTETKDNRPELAVPKASVGGIVPYLLGEFRISSPNYIWIGNVQNLVKETLTEEQTVNEQFKAYSELPYTSNVNQVVQGPSTNARADGYTIYDYTTTITKTIEVVGYSIDVLLAICLGPDVELLRIRHGDVVIWEGLAQHGHWEPEVPGNPILQNGFGFYAGNFNQLPSTHPSQFEDPAKLPGYVGISYIIIRAVDTANLNGAALSFDVRRMPDYLGLGPALNTINDHDLNPASAMVDVLVNEWGAMGIGIDNIDFQSFQDAALLFAAEGHGMSLATDTENFGTNILYSLQQQTRSLIFANPNTGKITCRPLRSGLYYHSTPNALYVDESNITNMQELSKTDWQDIPSHIELKYFDRENGYKTVSMLAPNPSIPPKFDRSRRRVEMTLPTVASGECARKVMDLLQTYSAAPVLSAKFQVNREVADVLPGDVIYLSWPKMDLVNFPMYVTKRRETDERTNQIVIEAIQNDLVEIIGFYNAPQRPEPTPLDTAPKKPLHGRAIDTPFWLLRKFGYKQSFVERNETEFPYFLIRAANSLQSGYVLYNNAVGAPVKPNSKYPLSAKLYSPLTTKSGYMEWKLASIIIGEVINPHFLYNCGEAGIRSGMRLIFINDEILGYESFQNNNDGTYTLFNVHRGLIDTVPGDHGMGDFVTITDHGNDPFFGKAHAVGIDYEYGVVSRSFSGIMKYPDDKLDVPYSCAKRSNYTNRPTNIYVNSVRDPNPIGLSVGELVVVDWNSRSRLTKDISLALDGQEWYEQYNMTDFQCYSVYLTDSANQTVYVGAVNLGDFTETIPSDYMHVTFRLDLNAISAKYGVNLAFGVGFLQVKPGVYVNPDDLTPRENYIINISDRAEKIAINIVPS